MAASATPVPPEQVARLAAEAKRAYGELADEYAAARARAAEQMGAEERSDVWEEVEKLIENQDTLEPDAGPSRRGAS